MLYPPSSVQFAPARLSTSLSTGGQGAGAEREVVATSSECLRLWDLVSEPEDGSGGRAGNGFVGQGKAQSRSGLVSRATLQNVRGYALPFQCEGDWTDLFLLFSNQSKADFSAPLTSFSWSLLEPTHIVTSSIDTVRHFLPLKEAALTRSSLADLHRLGHFDGRSRHSAHRPRPRSLRRRLVPFLPGRLHLCRRRRFRSIVRPPIT